MDTLPLPPRPDLAQYRKRAKALVTAANGAAPDAVAAWARDWLTRLAALRGVKVTAFVQASLDRAVAAIEASVAERRRHSAALSLADAQFLVARAHGFDTWAAFAAHVRGLRLADPAAAPFEAAADAIVTGDLAALDRLLRDHPGLVRQRSAREHHATLLHYVSANGIEDFRQVTPPNAVAVAARLLEAGAEVDAIADTYGGGPAQTTMNLLVSSTHPADAGLQSPLVELLLDHGASVDGLEGNGSPILTALAFGYRDAAETLARRGARIEHVVVAAAIGRLDLVQAWVVDAATVAPPHPPYRGPYWVRIPDDAPGQLRMALVWACKFGRVDVARFLLATGVDPRAADADAMTALHWAAASGTIDLIDDLVRRGASLEARNTWGGTVLDSTVYFAKHQPWPGADYPGVLERLLKAGADPVEVHPRPTGDTVIDELITRYGRPGG